MSDKKCHARLHPEIGKAKCRLALLPILNLSIQQFSFPNSSDTHLSAFLLQDIALCWWVSGGSMNVPSSKLLKKSFCLKELSSIDSDCWTEHSRWSLRDGMSQEDSLWVGQKVNGIYHATFDCWRSTLGWIGCRMHIRRWTGAIMQSMHESVACMMNRWLVWWIGGLYDELPWVAIWLSNAPALLLSLTHLPGGAGRLRGGE